MIYAPGTRNPRAATALSDCNSAFAYITGTVGYYRWTDRSSKHGIMDDM